MDINEFIRKWGAIAHLTRDPDGTVGLWNSRQASAADRLMRVDFGRITSFERVSRVRHPYFKTSMKVNPASAQGWTYDEDDILNARYKNGSLIEKFSWCPVTGEFLLIPPGKLHATVKGGKPFDDYVRGIILRKKKMVTFRPYWPTYRQTLGAYSQFDADDWDVSMDAQEKAEAMIRKHGGNEGWTFINNVGNKSLGDLSGDYLRKW